MKDDPWKGIDSQEKLEKKKRRLIDQRALVEVEYNDMLTRYTVSKGMNQLKQVTKYWEKFHELKNRLLDDNLLDDNSGSSAKQKTDEKYLMLAYKEFIEYRPD